MIRTLAAFQFLIFIPMLTFGQPVTGTGPDEASWIQIMGDAQDLTYFMQTQPVSVQSYQFLSETLLDNSNLYQGILIYLKGQGPTGYRLAEVIEPLLREYWLQYQNATGPQPYLYSTVRPDPVIPPQEIPSLLGKPRELIAVPMNYIGIK